VAAEAQGSARFDWPTSWACRGVEPGRRAGLGGGVEPRERPELCQRAQPAPEERILVEQGRCPHDSLELAGVGVAQPADLSNPDVHRNPGGAFATEPDLDPAERSWVVRFSGGDAGEPLPSAGIEQHVRPSPATHERDGVAGALGPSQPFGFFSVDIEVLERAGNMFTAGLQHLNRPQCATCPAKGLSLFVDVEKASQIGQAAFWCNYCLVGILLGRSKAQADFPIVLRAAAADKRYAVPNYRLVAPDVDDSR
jgi:hypothetical protein